MALFETCHLHGNCGCRLLLNDEKYSHLTRVLLSTVTNLSSTFTQNLPHFTVSRGNSTNCCTFLSNPICILHIHFFIKSVRYGLKDFKHWKNFLGVCPHLKSNFHSCLGFVQEDRSCFLESASSCNVPAIDIYIFMSNDLRQYTKAGDRRS